MPALSIRIALDCFYLLIFYSEKFSTDVCRLPYAVNVNLNLSNSTHCKGMQSIHCVLVACNSGRDSYRKTMSNEEGHNCLNNENKINMKV